MVSEVLFSPASALSRALGNRCWLSWTRLELLVIGSQLVGQVIATVTVGSDSSRESVTQEVGSGSSADGGGPWPSPPSS